MDYKEAVWVWIVTQHGKVEYVFPTQDSAEKHVIKLFYRDVDKSDIKITKHAVMSGD